MTYNAIRGYDSVNDTESEKVNELVSSLLTNGWQGAPILVQDEIGRLVTGSHRLAALKQIEDVYLENADGSTNETAYALIYEVDIAKDVDDIVNDYCLENDTVSLPYDTLSKIFEGTWVEEYKDELEW